MKWFDIFKREGREKDANSLYDLLTTKDLPTDFYKMEDLGEEMAVLHEVIGEYWKPRFLVDHRAKKAYEFMNELERLVTVTHDDIDWESLEKIKDEEAIETARKLDFSYPSFIRNFKNGKARVDWQLNPDGMYYMDEDGYGMTNDQEVNIHGFIDRTGKVVVKFKYG